MAWEHAWELETGLKVGTYITDNGELKSDKMHNWLASRGTSQLFAAPYTLAHNGHVECMHCTLMAKARTMHIYMKCPPNMWDGLYLTAGHLQDKTTTHSLQGTMRWEKWYEPTQLLFHERNWLPGFHLNPRCEEKSKISCEIPWMCSNRLR